MAFGCNAGNPLSALGRSEIKTAILCPRATRSIGSRNSVSRRGFLLVVIHVRFWPKADALAQAGRVAAGMSANDPQTTFCCAAAVMAAFDRFGDIPLHCSSCPGGKT
jgi:hypothetical protein